MYTIKCLLEVNKINLQAHLYTMHCSIIFLRVNICLLHGLQLLNPVCSSQSRVVYSPLQLVKEHYTEGLVWVDNSMISLHLLQSVRSLLLASLVMTPLHHSSGMFSSPQVVLNKSWSASDIVSLLYLSSSAGISSTPGVLLKCSTYLALCSFLASRFYHSYLLLGYIK